jgi:bifunctional DNA-binding transcriptional regulator/antitoxin component of YhaV-PrlF toxin-antitoxin module
MKISKVTSGGKVTVPAELKKKYKLTPGRWVKFEAVYDGIKIIPLVTPEEIKANAGFLGTKGKLLKALMEEKKKEQEL